MRYFKDFEEAHSELRRELAEMGVKDNRRVVLLNHQYTVLKPDYTEIPDVHEEWIELEWKDRVIGDLNPGKSWRKWPEVWEQRLEVDLGLATSGHKRRTLFPFTHSRRIGGVRLQRLVQDLKDYPDSDDLFLTIWHPIDNDRRELRRVPDDLGYWVKVVEGAVELTYICKRSNLIELGSNVALAVMLQWYLAQKADRKVGRFVHYNCMLTADQEELADVF